MNVVNVLGYPGKQTTTRNHHGPPPKILVNRERTPGRYHLLAVLFRGGTVSGLQGLPLGHVRPCFCTPYNLLSGQ